MDPSLPNVNLTTVANSYSWLNHVDVLILKSFLIVLTVTLNTIVVFVFTCLIRKRTYTNFLFLSISISDLGIGLLAMSSQVNAYLNCRNAKL